MRSTPQRRYQRLTFSQPPAILTSTVAQPNKHTRTKPTPVPPTPKRLGRSAQNLIANLRGVPENQHHELPERAKPLGSILQRVFKTRIHSLAESPESIIDARWCEIVGEEAAARCHPIKLTKNGKLYIGVGNPTLRQELMFRQRTIVRNIKRIPGCEAVVGVVLQ